MNELHCNSSLSLKSVRSNLLRANLANGGHLGAVVILICKSTDCIFVRVKSFMTADSRRLPNFPYHTPASSILTTPYSRRRLTNRINLETISVYLVPHFNEGIIQT